MKIFEEWRTWLGWRYGPKIIKNPLIGAIPSRYKDNSWEEVHAQTVKSSDEIENLDHWEGMEKRSDILVRQKSNRTFIKKINGDRMHFSY